MFEVSNNTLCQQFNETSHSINKHHVKTSELYKDGKKAEIFFSRKAKISFTFE